MVVSYGCRDGSVHLPGDVAGKGEWRAMMAHELLRQAAQILGAGWSKGSNARDDTGRIVPLWAPSYCAKRRKSLAARVCERLIIHWSSPYEKAAAGLLGSATALTQHTWSRRGCAQTINPRLRVATGLHESRKAAGESDFRAVRCRSIGATSRLASADS